MANGYTLLIRAPIISGRHEPDVTALAWASDAVKYLLPSISAPPGGNHGALAQLDMDPASGSE